MFENYLVNNRLWIKNSFSIESYVSHAEFWSSGSIIISFEEGDLMEIFQLQRHKIYFMYDDKMYIYDCDVEIFCRLHCFTFDEIRDLKLEKII